MSESFRQFLRALPDFPEVLPDFDPAAPGDRANCFGSGSPKPWRPECRSPTPAAWPPPMDWAGRRRGC